MTDYDGIECEHKNSPYDVCGNVSLAEKDGETVRRDDFQGEETTESITIDELLDIYNGTEAE